MALGSDVARQIGGAAVAAFGFSLGGEVYKSTRKNQGKLVFGLIVVTVIAVTVFGVFYAGLWLFRNYRDMESAILGRLGAILALLASAVGGIFPLLVLSMGLVEIPLVRNYFPEGMPLPGILYDLEYAVRWLWDGLGSENIFRGEYGAQYDMSHVLMMKWLVILTALSLGSLVGLSQRGKRAAFWAAEDHNKDFLSKTGISEKDNGQLVDSFGNIFRVESQTTREIELFAVGRRNRRAYISLDGAGKMTDWSGLVSKKA